MRDHVVKGPSGRQLQVLETGDPEGLPIITVHGTPLCRFVFPAHAADADAAGIRLISYDRPGYGRSTAAPGFRIAETARDVEAIADSLAIPKFAVWGFSGGGAPALSCAALLPNRVVAVASIGGLAPYPSSGWDWFEGMAPANADDFQLLVRDRGEWERQSLEDWHKAQAQSREEFRYGWVRLCSDRDLLAFSEDLVTFFAKSRSEAIQAGAEGWMGDSVAQISPWGFDVESIDVPVQIWHGEEDRFVPPSHGRWLGSRIPQADVHIPSNEGHLSIFSDRVPEIHRWLCDHF
jgi:pimeloyl-ACP methyl ester carboxylesterase